MSRVRKNYPANFKKQVVVAAFKEDCTMAELSSRFGVSSVVISRWKKEALASIENGFLGKIEKKAYDSDTHIKELHAKIGELTVERDFLVDASNRLGLGGEKSLWKPPIKK